MGVSGQWNTDRSMFYGPSPVKQVMKHHIRSRSWYPLVRYVNAEGCRDGPELIRQCVSVGASAGTGAQNRSGQVTSVDLVV